MAVGSEEFSVLLNCLVMKPRRSFASDNNAVVHPEVLEAIRRANEGHVVGYGSDPHTESAVAKFREQFGADVAVFFVFNGTAANVLSLQALTRPFHAVLCPELSHIYTDECGAPEKFTGCKLVPLAAPDGKLTVETVSDAYHGIGDQHHVQPRVISITQSTEMGTVYKPAEIEALARFAHERKMFLHMDGARISNAVVAQRPSVSSPSPLSLRQATRDLGVDVLSFGGTKNGLMGVEAVVFFRPELAENFLFVRKQGMQLASKMRFMSVQMEALLTNDLWRRNAEHANGMARLLEQETRKIPRVKIVYPVEANGVFAQVPREAIQKIQERYFFYVWSEEESVVRWMCSFDTTETDVREFAEFVGAVVREVPG
jgi:threonine aldolase